jgi:SAM-dependent methyltransferase
VERPAWIDLDADRAIARQLEERWDELSTEDIVRRVFRHRWANNDAWVDRRTRQVLEAPVRLTGELRDWLDECTAPGRLFLDLGCGPGMLLAAATATGRAGIGLDVSLAWLIVAHRLISEHGGAPVLAAAFAEALPLRDDAVSGVVALDVIEHVADQAAMLQEVHRVTRPGGYLALATPNRFSLGPEPHVSVWGVGWLPRRLQGRYVRWRTGHDYGMVSSLSTWDAARLIRRHTSFAFTIVAPEIPGVEIDHFSSRKACLARLYNRLIRLGWSKPILLPIGPFFRILGAKPNAIVGPRIEEPPGAAGDGGAQTES